MRLEDVVFLELDHVHAAHDAAIKAGGGADGVLNLGMIASAVAAPQNGYYTTLAELAAVYTHGIASNHGYLDGNKRTAALVLGVFLGANGFPVVLAPEWVGVIESVADGSTSRHQLTDIIVARLLGGTDVPVDD